MIQNHQVDENPAKTNDASHASSNNQEQVSPSEGTPEGMTAGFAELLRAMEPAHAALSTLDAVSRTRAIRWLAEALDVEIQGSARQTQSAVMLDGATPVQNTFQEARDTATPRDFMSQKKPQSQVERVACLAYYLARHRGAPHFKAADIAELNTEAAGHRFGNISRDVDNADRQNGYIVSAGNGAKQLTVRGEAVVEALPDREAVKAALSEHPHKRKRPSTNAGKKGKAETVTNEQ